MPRRVLAFAGARRDVAPLRGRAVQAEHLAEIEHDHGPDDVDRRRLGARRLTVLR